jgi:hypothetical protein
VVDDPTDRGPTERLDAYRVKAGLTHGELWLRYFELGGMSSELELEAILYGVLEPSPRDHEVIALALNERFMECASEEAVPYQEDPEDDPGPGGARGD